MPESGRDNDDDDDDSVDKDEKHPRASNNKVLEWIQNETQDEKKKDNFYASYSLRCHIALWVVVVAL